MERKELEAVAVSVGQSRETELEADGEGSRGRSEEGDGARIEVDWRGGRVAEWSRDAEEGSEANQRAEWRPPPEKGRSGGHSQEEFAGASAVQSVNS